MLKLSVNPKLSLKLKPLKNIKETVFFKDYAKKSLLKERPELSELLDELEKNLPNKKYLTFDYAEQTFIKGRRSCRDPGWHVDGEGNHYLLVCWGDFRTEFINRPWPHMDSLIAKNEAIKALGSQLEPDFEVEEGVAVIYDSQTLHRGRIATGLGKRIFLRICASDYIRPKNKRL